MKNLLQSLVLLIACYNHTYGMNFASACTEKTHGCWQAINERIFFEAVCENYQTIVRKMLYWKLIDPNFSVEPYVYSDTTLTEIEVNGNIYIVNFATNHFNQTAPQTKETALMYAIVCGHKEIVRLLLDAHADPAVQNRWGITPLMLAAFKGNAEIVRLVIAALHKRFGTTDYLTLAINMQSFAGTTALIFATSQGHLTATQILMEAGAQAQLKNNNGQLAKDFVIQNNNLTNESKEHFLSILDSKLCLIPLRKRAIELPESESPLV